MISENNNLPHKDSIPFWLLALLATTLGVGIYLRFEALEYVLINEWITRDFERAFNIVEGNYIPLAGPELTHGGRLPGPFLYFFQAIPLILAPSYESIFVFNFIINVASLIGVFFVVKRYFNFFIASVATAFFSLHFLSLFAILFPANPSFIFPFVTLYLWFFLEFFINHNHRAIPPLVLSICLGMQIHYSVATYILAPVFLAIFFKIKIPIKTIVASLILVVLCISPYLVHKQMMFIPTIDRFSQYLFSLNTNYLEIIKAVGLVHMKNYLPGWGTIAVSPTPIPFTLKLFYYVGSLVSFYVLLGIVLFKIRSNGWLANRKELCILALFYFPSIIYGFINPYTGHVWYSYVFVVPQALVIALCIYSIYEFLSGVQDSIHRILEKSFIALILTSFLLLTIVLIKHTSQSLKSIKQIQSHVGIAMPYKNMRDILRSVMTSLDLSPDEFYQRVYFLYFDVSSRRMLEASETNALEKNGANKIKKEKPCFFVKGKDQAHHSMPKLKRAKFDLFLKDPTIKILSKEYITMNQLRLSNSLEVHTYKPLFSQPCYSNNFNKFVIDKGIRELLINAKNVSNNNEVASVKPISVVSKYNSNQELEYLEGHYVISHRVSQAPFGFKISIKKSGGAYLIRGTIQSIYFSDAPRMHPKKMDLLLRLATPSGPMKRPSKVPTGVTFQRNEIRLNMLPKNTLVSEVNNNTSLNWSYNQYWYREYKIPSLLIHGKQDVYLAWSQPAKSTTDPDYNFEVEDFEDLQVKLSLNPN